jgi:chemotaxis protein CheD
MPTQRTSQQTRHIVSPAKCEMVTVEPGHLKVSVRLTDSLVAYGLGACVCVCLYDYEMKIAGMAHIPLPGSNSDDRTGERLAGRHSDTAIATLLEEMRRAGAVMSNLRAAISGGAKVLNLGSSSLPHSLQLGMRNIKAVTAELENRGIPILGKDIGGYHGRTIVFRTCDGSIIVKRSAEDAQVFAKLNSLENRLAVSA